MKQPEKQRLTNVTHHAVAQITWENPKIKEYAEKAAASFSPTNGARYRTLAEIAWWLIALNRSENALLLLDALCEVDDEYYWMFHALSSAFATRAWLRKKRKEEEAARNDARAAIEWLHRDPNVKPITETEVRNALKRFDDWFASAAGERGTMMALRVLSHAMRVLVMYQQCANAGDPVVKTIPSDEFTTRLDAGVSELRRRIESW